MLVVDGNTFGRNREEGILLHLFGMEGANIFAHLPLLSSPHSVNLHAYDVFNEALDRLKKKHSLKEPHIVNCRSIQAQGEPATREP